MTPPLILASSSATRRAMLENAGVIPELRPARIDEEAIRLALVSDGANPRDIADHLAEQKTRRIAAKEPARMVLGSDQVLAFEGEVLGKAPDAETLRAQLARLNGKTHHLYSAAVIYDAGEPVWRHVGHVRMHMRRSSDSYLDDYVARNWDEVRHCVGGYQIEHEGLRLFSRIEGDYFSVLGLPLTELLGYLTLRGVIDG